MENIEERIIETCEEHFSSLIRYTQEVEKDTITIDLSVFDDELREDIINDFYNSEVKNKLQEVIDSKLAKNCNIKFKNINNNYQIRHLSSDNIGELVELKCVVISASSPQSIPQKKCYRCLREICSERYYISKGQKIPNSCPECGGELTLDETNTVWTDYQVLNVQESPETMTMGETPRPLRVRLIGEHLVDTCRVGDNVDIIGVMRTEPSSKKGVYSWYVMGNNIITSSLDIFETELTDMDIGMVENWSRRPDIEEVLINSLFPSIYGNDYEKKGLVLALFGGKSSERRDVDIRSAINVLLIGDPSTAKTAMINAIARQAPKSIYTQAGGVTGVGLTAAVIRDESQWVLAAGSVILANGGICCIDELEKMDKEDQDKILECMEKQTVSIHKASVHTTLPAKTTILAAGNPKFGSYNYDYTLSENINLPSPLLARFDLIFIMKDIPDKRRDRAIAEKILKGYSEETETEDMIDIDTLRKYVIYAKRLRPEISKEAMEMIMDFYIKIRQEERGEDDPIPITARQLQGLLRMSIAFSRIKLLDTVGIPEAGKAIDMYQEILDRIGSQITTGGDKYTVTKQTEYIKKLLPLGVHKYKDVIRDKALKMMPEEHANKVLDTIKQLERDGHIYSPEPHLWCRAREL